MIAFHSRGAYDSIVYIDGSRVVAEDAFGKQIADGIAGSDDSTNSEDHLVIKAAMEYKNGQTVYLAPGDGNFVVASPIAPTCHGVRVTSSNNFNSPWSLDVPHSSFRGGSATPVFDLSQARFCTLDNLSFKNVSKAISVKAGVGNHTGLIVDNCFFADISDTVLELDGSAASMSGPYEFTHNMIWNHCNVIGNYGVHVIQGNDYTISDIIIDCNGFEPTFRIAHIGLTLNGANSLENRVQFESICKNYFEYASATDCGIYIDHDYFHIKNINDNVSYHSWNNPFCDISAAHYARIVSIKDNLIANACKIYLYGAYIEGLDISGNYFLAPDIDIRNTYGMRFHDNYMSFVTLNLAWPRNCVFHDNKSYYEPVTPWTVTVSNGNVIWRDNDGYVTENSGSSEGTGSEQTIPHGLAITPTPQKVILIAGSAMANPYHSKAPDATNIYVVAGSGQPWYWNVP